MLRKVVEVRGVGLLHDANGGGKLPLEKVALIYGENGRGKSTLASILRAASNGDAKLRTTLGGQIAPAVAFLFAPSSMVRFDGKAWSAPTPRMHIFDAEFVDQNVYSGRQVTPAQRRGLLEVMLGRHSVLAQKAIDAAAEGVATQNKILKDLRERLAGYHKGIDLASFTALPPQQADDVDQLDTLRRRISDLSKLQAIQQKPVPTAVDLPALKVDAFFAILREALADIEENAERHIREHSHGRAAGFEAWASEGAKFALGDECPYCGQGTDGVALVRAYRTHFNNAYDTLKRRVSSLVTGIEKRVGDAEIERFAAGVADSLSAAAQWSDQVPFEPVAFDRARALALAGELRALLLGLATAKQQRPLKFIGTEEQQKAAEKLWEALQSHMQDCNGKLLQAAQKIQAFKRTLSVQNISTLKMQEVRLQLAPFRHSPAVQALLADLNAASTEKTRLEKEKYAAKASFDALVPSIQPAFERRINALLKSFAAGFQIKAEKPEMAGGLPRLQYSILLQKQQVALTSFGTTLSEGDKRTLAFAFFVASVESDPDIASAILVFDDPMSSLDRSRRTCTRTVLRDLARRSAQVIVLGHDPFFLKELRDDLDRDSIPCSAARLQRVTNDYSDFAPANLDHLCESTYSRHHRLVSEYVGGIGHSPEEVAKAIRPMLEGYLHRRFPGIVSRRDMFGQILGNIRGAAPDHPLANLIPATAELNEINDYVGRFHHDTEAAAALGAIDEAELAAWARRALQVVYRGH